MVQEPDTVQKTAVKSPASLLRRSRHVKIAMTYFALQSETTYYVPLVTKFWDKLLEYVLAVILDAIATSPDPNAAPMPGNLSGFKSAAFANIAGLYMSVFHASKALACDRRSAKIVAKIWAKTTPTDPERSGIRPCNEGALLYTRYELLASP